MMKKTSVILGATTVMQKSLLNPWDQNHTMRRVLNLMKTKTNENLLKSFSTNCWNNPGTNTLVTYAANRSYWMFNK